MMTGHFLKSTNSLRKIERYLIVNADDFGLSKGINSGIIYSHVNGIVTSTSLLACMPESINAIRLANECPGLGVGVHLNYNLGENIFPSNMANRLFYKGRARFSIPKLWLLSAINKIIRKEIYQLFRYQIIWIQKHGITAISHLDTHKHLHIWPWIANILIKLAKEFNIPAIRLPYESPWIKGPYNLTIKMYLTLLLPFAIITKYLLKKREDIISADKFIGILLSGFWSKKRFYCTLSKLPYGLTEIMVHPGYKTGLKRKETRLILSREYELHILCDPDILTYCKNNKIKLINYHYFG